MALLMGAFFSLSNAKAAQICDEVITQAKLLPSKDAAIAHIEARRVECSNNPQFLAALSRAYFENNRLNEAEATAVAGLKLAPQADFLLFGLGDIKLRQGHLDDAKELAERLIKHSPHSYAGPYLMQRVLMDSKQFAEAMKFGDNAVDLSKGSVPVLYLNNAVAAYHAGQDTRCVEYVLRAIERDPRVLGQAWGIDEAIYALDRSKRFREALELAKRRKNADLNWRDDAQLVKILGIMGLN